MTEQKKAAEAAETVASAAIDGAAEAYARGDMDRMVLHASQAQTYALLAISHRLAVVAVECRPVLPR